MLEATLPAMGAVFVFFTTGIVQKKVVADRVDNLTRLIDAAGAVPAWPTGIPAQPTMRVLPGLEKEAIHKALTNDGDRVQLVGTAISALTTTIALSYLTGEWLTVALFAYTLAVLAAALVPIGPSSFIGSLPGKPPFGLTWLGTFALGILVLALLAGAVFDLLHYLFPPA